MINTIRRATYWAGLVVIAFLNRRESFAEFIARQGSESAESADSDTVTCAWCGQQHTLTEEPS